MTGASNRHLGLLYTLAYLGHSVKRAALRVGPNKILPGPAKLIFENMKISQHNKRLLNNRKNDLQEYVSLVLDWKPDLVIMTLWFCGPTIDFTVPGYLINIHKSKKLTAKILIESSDVRKQSELLIYIYIYLYIYILCINNYTFFLIIS
jgi:hypothetical protein